MAERLDLREGDPLILEVVGNKIILTPVRIPSQGKVEAWAEVTPGEVEGVGEEITKSINLILKSV